MTAASRQALLIEMDGGPSGTWWELSTVADNGPLTDEASGLDAEVAACLAAGNLGQAVTVLADEGYEVVLHSLAWWNETGSREQPCPACGMDDTECPLFGCQNSDGAA
jgi:hypothetical protein